MTATVRLHLEWKVLDDKRCALIFDTTTFRLLQDKADALGIDTNDMIAEAVAGLLGPIVARKVTERD